RANVLRRAGVSKRAPWSGGSGPRSPRRGRGVVFLVGHVLGPVHGGALIVDFLHSDVSHEAIRGGTVPVILAGPEVDAVPRADDLDRPAAALTASDALDHIDRLAARVRVPRGASARREVNAAGRQARWLRSCRNRIEVDRAGEPFAR